MKWLLWRKAVARSEEAVRAAELLRDTAQAQQRRVERIGPRVDALVNARLRSE